MKLIFLPGIHRITKAVPLDLSGPGHLVIDPAAGALEEQLAAAVGENIAGAPLLRSRRRKKKAASTA